MSVDMQAIYVLHPTMGGMSYQNRYNDYNQVSKQDYDSVVRENENLSYNYNILKQRYAILVALVVFIINMLLIMLEEPIKKAINNATKYVTNTKHSFINKQPMLTLDLSDLSESSVKLRGVVYTTLSDSTSSIIKTADSDTESVTSEDTIKFAKSIKPATTPETATQKSAPAAITTSATPESTK